VTTDPRQGALFGWIRLDQACLISKQLVLVSSTLIEFDPVEEKAALKRAQSKRWRDGWRGRTWRKVRNKRWAHGVRPPEARGYCTLMGAGNLLWERFLEREHLKSLRRARTMNRSSRHKEALIRFGPRSLSLLRRLLPGRGPWEASTIGRACVGTMNPPECRVCAVRSRPIPTA
jgi:hypothetical protein